MTVRHVGLTCAALVLLGLGGETVDAYKQISGIAGTRRIFVRWASGPVRYVVNDRAVPGVTSAQLRSTISRAFGRWQDVATASITFEDGGVTSALPGDEDGLNTFGFLTRPDMLGVLGATGFIVDVVTGELVESDVFFNSAYAWSVAENGEPDRFDLESVAVHEVGHFLGLDHSELGELEIQEDSLRVKAAEAVMFPIAFDPGTIDGRRLKADDIAGASSIYPDGSFSGSVATIRGRVVKGDRAVFGAHVMAFNPFTGKMIAGFTLENGEFAITGLDPGAHILRVEPIDDSDVISFFDEPPFVDLDFKTVFFNRLITVDAGATSPLVEITVEAK